MFSKYGHCKQAKVEQRLLQNVTGKMLVHKFTVLILLKVDTNENYLFKSTHRIFIIVYSG